MFLKKIEIFMFLKKIDIFMLPTKIVMLKNVSLTIFEKDKKYKIKPLGLMITISKPKSSF